MGTRVIDLDPLNPLSVLNAERQLRMAQREFDQKVDLFLHRLAEIGRDAAQGAYGDGGSVSVTIEQIPDGFAIRADGDAVVFLEFGAGDAVNTANRYAGEMPFEVSSGSWSRQNIDRWGRPGPYARFGWWVFAGRKYTEIQPRNGMERAYEEIISHIQSAAREVFGS